MIAEDILNFSHEFIDYDRTKLPDNVDPLSMLGAHTLELLVKYEIEQAATGSDASSSSSIEASSLESPSDSD